MALFGDVFIHHLVIKASELTTTPSSLLGFLLQCRRHGFSSWVGKIPWRREWLPTPVLGFPSGSDGKESACSAGDLGSVPGLGISPGEGKGNPLQYSCLENSMDRGALVSYSPGWGLQRVKHDWATNTSLHFPNIYLIVGDPVTRFCSSWSKPSHWGIKLLGLILLY